MELRDANGLTEAEFLARYRQKDYPRPSLTVDMVVFACASAQKEHADALGLQGREPAAAKPCVPNDAQVLLIQRGGHPYLGCWALPGGFAAADEPTEQAAARELEEETGARGLAAEQLGLYSTPGRDPRGWVVSAAYVACADECVRVQAADDAAAAQWCRLEVLAFGDDEHELRVRAGDDTLRAVFACRKEPSGALRASVSEASGFAFDHAQIIADALVRVFFS